MATFEAVFLKIKEAPNEQLFNHINNLIQANRKGFFREHFVMRYLEGFRWIQIRGLSWIGHLLDGRDKSYQPKFAALLSEHFQTDVICLYTQTVVDAVGYWHFQNGVETRCLASGFYRERAWEEIRGKAEEWEDKAFFDLTDYAEILNEDDILAAEITQLFQTKQLKTGLEFPFFCSSNIRQIANHFDLPGFSNQSGWTIERTR